MTANHTIIGILIGMGFLAGSGARAAAAPSAATVLSLTVIGRADHTPDQLVARMSVQDDAPTAASAQAAVNRTMGLALAQAEAIKGLHVTTGSYDVAPTDPKHTAWHAQQTMILRYAASPNTAATAAVRRLIGSFQARSIVLDGIAGGLSSAAARDTRERAIADAVRQLRAEAAATASALGDRVGAITRITLTGQTPFHPLMLAMRSAEVVLPQTQPGAITEQISLFATVELHPAPSAGSKR
ncbi:SIMPL domain-containing protein [Acidiphilium sp.]|uniref:SIMPL domain-containing protein n=1 Tax=Acidiphilium sp. TaxID=527 RepID=UPI003D022471